MKYFYELRWLWEMKVKSRIGFRLAHSSWRVLLRFPGPPSWQKIDLHFIFFKTWTKPAKKTIKLTRNSIKSSAWIEWKVIFEGEEIFKFSFWFRAQTSPGWWWRNFRSAECVFVLPNASRGTRYLPTHIFHLFHGLWRFLAFCRANRMEIFYCFLSTAASVNCKA